MWFGTIPELVELYKTSPQDVHPMTTMTLLYRKYQLGDLYYSDTWPGADSRHMLLNSPVCIYIYIPFETQRWLTSHRN
jgi:hypothetical protein